MAEVSSQPTIDTASEVSSQAPVTSAPVPAGGNGLPVTPQQTPTSTPVETPPASPNGNPGPTGDNTFKDYAAEKAAFLAGAPVVDDNTPAPEPAPEPPPVPEPAPAPAPVPSKMPKVHVNGLQNDEQLQGVMQFRDYARNGGTLSLTEWVLSQQPSPVATAAPQPEVHPAPAPAPAPQTMSPAAIKQRMAEIADEQAAAAEAFDMPKIAKLTRESGELAIAYAEALDQAKIDAARQQEQQTTAQTAFDSAVTAYEQTAVQMFGASVNDPSSALSQAAARILAEAQASGNPAAFMPEFTLTMWTQAAAEVGQAPAPRPQQVVLSPVVPAVPARVVASGDSRAFPAQSPVSVEDIKTMDEYYAAKADLLRRSA